jgi:hypothetical protein
VLTTSGDHRRKLLLRIHDNTPQSSCRGSIVQRHLACLLLLLSCAHASGKEQKPSDRTLRWDAANPECTVTATGGMHRYSIDYETLKLTLAVDDNELKKTNRTAEHVFSVLVTVNNHGNQAADLVVDEIKLELVQHHHVLVRAEVPDTLAHRIQADTDELVYQSEKTIKKHPEKKDALELKLQEHQQLVSRWLEFLTTQALRDVRVDSGRPEVTGWVFFSTRSKWLGTWKEHEEFILRIPIGKRVFEFPFALPAEGMPALRQRGQPES